MSEAKRPEKDFDSLLCNNLPSLVDAVEHAVTTSKELPSLWMDLKAVKVSKDTDMVLRSIRLGASALLYNFRQLPMQL